jgi:predicted hotdog family 3-hydroxylacyl-ACP dehydratase
LCQPGGGHGGLSHPAEKPALQDGLLAGYRRQEIPKGKFPEYTRSPGLSQTLYRGEMYHAFIIAIYSVMLVHAAIDVN